MFDIHKPPIKGRVRGCYVNASGKMYPRLRWCHNLVLYDWATIVAKLLLRQGDRFGIAGMYLEFENVTSPGDTVSAPSFDRGPESGVEYYNSLSGSGVRDYLRVPLVSGALVSTDDELFPSGNRMTFFAQSSGVVGVHGRTFSDAVNSKVFGGALVAMPEESDSTQDLVFSRFYFDAAAQQIKLSTSQVGLDWETTLG